MKQKVLCCRPNNFEKTVQPLLDVGWILKQMEAAAYAMKGEFESLEPPAVFVYLTHD